MPNNTPADKLAATITYKGVLLSEVPDMAAKIKRLEAEIERLTKERRELSESTEELGAERDELLRELDWLEKQRPCSVQMWIGHTAIHKPGDTFSVNEIGKTLRELIQAAMAREKGGEEKTR